MYFSYSLEILEHPSLRTNESLCHKQLKILIMKNSMHLKLVLAGLLGLSSFQIQAQLNGRVWARVSDQNSTPRLESNGDISSPNPIFAEALNQAGVIGVKQALSNSRNAKLQEVYEFSCSCSQSELETTLRLFPTVVQGIERAPQYQTLYIPNDYGLVLSEDYALDLIQAPIAWDITHSNSNMVIAISDENLDPNHEEIAGKLVYYDMHNPLPTSHGNAVAIIAAGNTDNNIGVSSVGFNSSLAFYQMDFNEILAATYAGIDIINISWFSGCSFSQYEQDVITEAYQNGSFIIAAAGNGNTCGSASDMVFPASYASVFSVTSIGKYDNHEDVIGDPNTTHQHNPRVDLSAPGYEVGISTSPNHYLIGSGSSYAAPYVSGTVALMLSVNPCLNNEAIEQILKLTSQNIDALNPAYVGQIGKGRLNTAAAVAMALTYGNNTALNPNTINSCVEGQGVITLNPSVAQEPFSVVWPHGMTGISNDSLVSGTYSITLTDAHGCVQTTTATINNGAAIVNGLTQNPLCFGSNNGSIDVISSINNCTYSWSNGATSEDLSNLADGIYTVTATNTNGCTTVRTFSLFAPQAILGSASTTADLGNQEGTIDLTITGGTPGYTYLWSNGSSTEDLSNLAAGTYQVTITDMNACVEVVDVTIENQSANGLSDENALSFKMYPNPSNGDATINWTGAAAELGVIDQNGKVINVLDVQGMNSIELTNLNKGLYQVKFTTLDGATTTKKLVVI